MPQVTITEVRNAQSLNAENTRFEVEINHPEYDWIPYALDPDDTDMTVDPVVTNPLRWAELTDAKQTEWTQYRTDLLNLPAQAGFPDNVTWPTKPE